MKSIKIFAKKGEKKNDNQIDKQRLAEHRKNYYRESLCRNLKGLS